MTGYLFIVTVHMFHKFGLLQLFYFLKGTESMNSE